MRFTQFVPKLPTLLAAFLVYVAPVHADESSLTVQGITERIQSGELDESPLFLPTAERRVVFANPEYFLPVRKITPGGNPYPLPATPTDLGSVTYEVNGEAFTLQEFLTQQPLMGFLVLRDGARLLEHYASDHSVDSRWISFSVTKSVT